MRSQLQIISAGVFLFLAVTLASANPSQTGTQSICLLNDGQLERVKVCKALLGEIDQEPIAKTVEKLQKLPNPEENLQIMEAVSATYAEIVKEKEVNDFKKRQWLHSMVQLNMAYLQLGGMGDKSADNEALNGLIRRRLLKHLPKELFENQEIFYTLE